MKVWTYLEQKTKIVGDCDLQDEQFIQSDEMIGYFNEAISEAEAEIHDTREEYFLTKQFIPSVINVNSYALPANIYANKIRGFVYTNGTIIYDIKKLKIWHKFTKVEYADRFGTQDDYQYYVTNDSPGNVALIITPPPRETSILPQLAVGNFQPFKLWYFRGASRIPVHGEYIPNFETYIIPSNVNIGTDVITLLQTTYLTGDQIKFTPVAAPGGASGLPAPLVANTVYFVITTGTPGQIKLATTAANAAAGTAIDLTTTGSSTGYFNVSIAAQDTLINAILVDIPEFSTFVMQWVKCRCFEKEGDPRLGGAVGTLEQQRKQMVDTLTEMIIDADTEVEADFTHYQEMS